jgi:hypothetical protein
VGIEFAAPQSTPLEGNGVSPLPHFNWSRDHPQNKSNQRGIMLWMSTRTKWTEEFAEAFASLPLVSECVFRSPMRMDRGIEKEVCDLAVSLRGDALLVQMGCQENPSTRSGDKLANWVLKTAREKLRQTQGAIGTVRKRDFWCDHPRRGRVAFRAAELRPVCGIVAVETLGEPVVLPPDFPLAHEGVPIAYFSMNDLHNVVYELRAFPEILEYLRRRSDLSPGALRIIGAERFLFLDYVKHGYSFDGWSGFEDATRDANAGNPLGEIRAARAGNEGAYLIERVADDLAVRASDYLDGMPHALAQRYDPVTRRRNYLRMQEELCDLPLRGRRVLGQQLWKVIQSVQDKAGPNMVYATTRADWKPDFLYVVAATRGLHRSTVCARGLHLLQSGLAHYAKRAGMFVADRDGEGFEVAYMADENPTTEACAEGQRLFGHLKILDY